MVTNQVQRQLACSEAGSPTVSVSPSTNALSVPRTGTPNRSQLLSASEAIMWTMSLDLTMTCLTANFLFQADLPGSDPMVRALFDPINYFLSFNFRERFALKCLLQSPSRRSISYDFKSQICTLKAVFPLLLRYFRLVQTLNFKSAIVRICLLEKFCQT